MTLTGGIQLCEDLMLLRMRSRPLERSPQLEQPPLRDLPGHRLRSPSPALPWPASEALGAQGKLSPLNPVLTSVSPPVFATRDPPECARGCHLSGKSFFVPPLDCAFLDVSASVPDGGSCAKGCSQLSRVWLFHLKPLGKGRGCFGLWGSGETSPEAPSVPR